MTKVDHAALTPEQLLKVESRREKSRERAARWRAASPENAEKNRAAAKKWYAENADRAKGKARARAEQNPERKRASDAAYRAANREKVRETVARWGRENPEKKKALNAAWATANPERMKAAAQKSRGKHSDRHATRQAFRRALKARATPGWAEEFFISEAYHIARLRTQATGFSWHVDHIVPLRSALVCGLHVEANLAVIPGKLNAKKSNLVWPDMPT
jgi:hypothetical protein